MLTREGAVGVLGSVTFNDGCGIRTLKGVILRVRCEIYTLGGVIKS